MTSKNPQLDASNNAMESSQEYLAEATARFHKAISALDISHNERMDLDQMVKNIQHYTYRVALSNLSIQAAKTLQAVYLGCSDPTGSKQFWRYNAEQKLAQEVSA